MERNYPKMSTEKMVSAILADVLAAHGVKQVVLSPGSRNAPVITAFARDVRFVKRMVVDERSAAFVALGISSGSYEPVAIVCTSGTALLNFAPAVAEAYYRKAPLIVISADRPMEWIDQDDSQTLVQPGALDNYVKKSYDIPATDMLESTRWYANRVINDAMLTALSGRRAPVHLNIQIADPFSAKDVSCRHLNERIIRMLQPRPDLTVSEARRIGHSLEGKKVMIVAGFHEPDRRLNKSLASLASRNDTVVLTESISNLHAFTFINRIDSTLSIMSDIDRSSLRPDVVITLGGALVSRMVKAYLRSYTPAEHWHVGYGVTTVDCFKSLTLRVEMDAGMFFQQLASAVKVNKDEGDYAVQWHEMERRARESHERYVASAPWSDMSALDYVFRNIPSAWNLQLSNGTPVRYAQLFDTGRQHRSDCNRGVSGIDGCTSTAIGAAMTYGASSTLLISGDLCAQYDVGALSIKDIPADFKMIVMCNGGGGIFRFISATSSLPELEDYFAVGSNIPLRELTEGYGFRFLEASTSEELEDVFTDFVSDGSRPVILAVHTPPEQSAEVLKNYFKRN